MNSGEAHPVVWLKVSSEATAGIAQDHSGLKSPRARGSTSNMASSPGWQLVLALSRGLTASHLGLPRGLIKYSPSRSLAPSRMSNPKTKAEAEMSFMT